MEKSRQERRAEFREEIKSGESRRKAASRRTAQKALLDRQTLREKSDAYTGRSTVKAVAVSRTRKLTRKVRKGNAFCRIIHSFTEGGREWSYHATKGWRSHRA